MMIIYINFTTYNLRFKATAQKLFASPFRWLILSDENISESNQLVFTLPALPDSDVVVAQETLDGFMLIERKYDLKLFFT